MSSKKKLPGDRFEILGRAKIGGMGEVYKVRQIPLDRVVAIKVMRDTAYESERLGERFVREARLASRLDHPNLVRFIDLSPLREGKAYMILEWVDGVDLAQLLSRSGTPPLDEAITIAKQTLGALAHLHGNGIVHRDISPDNLMVSLTPERELRVKLIDLGIAKSIRDDAHLTRTGLFVGKVHYAAPETLTQNGEGDPPDPRSDLYSFGVVLYEMLTGSRPVVGESHTQLIRGHTLRPPRPFTETDPHGRVPEELRRIVLKALEKGKEARFQSAEEFSRALVQIEGLRGESHEPAPASYRHLDLSTVALDTSGAVGDLAGLDVLDPGEDDRNERELSEIREAWFEKARAELQKRQPTRSGIGSSLMNMLQSHPKPVVAGASALLILGVLAIIVFVPGSESPQAAPDPLQIQRGVPESVPADSGGRVSGEPEQAHAGPDPLKSGPEEGTGGPPAAEVAVSALPGLAVISDSAAVTTAVIDALEGIGGVVLRPSLAAARSDAAAGRGPGLGLQLSATESRSTLEAYETRIPACEATVTAQLLTLPAGEPRFARTSRQTAPLCGEALAQAGRQIAAAVEPEVRRIQAK